ncbi:ribonuclease VapC20 [Methanobrevibacter cuticularis]|uniref:Ribonuclease VapC n=1 Tax=Methanobrevibacter cuticularis TaxID=47311 RepID=A0A166DG50_9EURY|nr:PIN domain-containing protein [Methanobrevibacter cuticularis]KZX15571.1 ribonuclease VapC20 [Methanobrevibacter cuticularis]
MIFLDSSYIVSLVVDSEEDHENALELFEKLEGKELVITNAVLTETINLLLKRLNRNTKAISEVYETITSEFTIIYENKELTQRAMETLIKYKATLGLADALSIEVMKELNIYEIFSFDDDFDNKEHIVWIH